MWTMIAIFSLLIFGGSLLSLPFVKGKRKKVCGLALLSLVVFLVAVVKWDDDRARSLGFVDANDERAAKDAGVSDPIAWKAARDAAAANAAAAAAKAKEEQRAAAEKREADQRAAKEEERAASEKREADQLAAEKAEEARCASDLRCIAEKKTIDASFKCRPLIERLAKNNFEWTDKWYESKLSHFKWKDRKALVITYAGDKIKYQNGFGAWVLSKYECDYNVQLGAAVEVRASPGRLPLD